MKLRRQFKKETGMDTKTTIWIPRAKDTLRGGDETGFRCRHCGFVAAYVGAGSFHRNHCPRCLHSVHLDDEPGDRASTCLGLMEPIAVWVRRDGEWALIHRCQDCGALASNRIGADDNEALLLSLAVRALAQPPFSLDRYEP